MKRRRRIPWLEIEATLIGLGLLAGMVHGVRGVVVTGFHRLRRLQPALACIPGPSRIFERGGTSS